MEEDVKPKADKAEVSQVVCRCQKTEHFARNCTLWTSGSESGYSKSDGGAGRGLSSHASMRVMPRLCPCFSKEHEIQSEQGETLHKSRLQAC